VKHPLGSAHRPLEAEGIGDVADAEVHVETSQVAGVVAREHQRAHLVAALGQEARHVAPDEARGASDEDLHVRLVSANQRTKRGVPRRRSHAWPRWRPGWISRISSSIRRMKPGFSGRS
jgi:hypothetical protein